MVKANTWVWEEFGEAVEKDFQIVSKRFWQTVRWLRGGILTTHCEPSVGSEGGVLRTLPEDIVGQWKEYLKDLLNDTNTSSVWQGESGDKGDKS